MLTIYALKTEKNWLLDFLEGLKDDFMKIVEDFGDVFISLKEIVYDGLVDKFGAMPINMLLIAVAFIAIILIFLKLFN
jgi:hypothetical protein